MAFECTAEGRQDKLCSLVCIAFDTLESLVGCGM